MCSHCYKDEFRLCDVDEEADDFELRHYTDTPLKFLQEMEKRMEADKADQAVADLELCDSACEITLRKQVDKHVQEHSTPVAVDGPDDDKQGYVTPRKTNNHFLIEDNAPIIASEKYASGQSEKNAAAQESQLEVPKILPRLNLPSVMPHKNISFGSEIPISPLRPSVKYQSTATKEDSSLPPIHLTSDKSEMSPKRQKSGFRAIKWYENKENPYIRKLQTTIKKKSQAMRLARMELASSEMKPRTRINYNQDTLTRQGALIDKPFYPR